MGLQLHNPRQSDTVTYLAVSFGTDLRNSVLSVGQAGLYAGAVFEVFNAFAFPAAVIVASTVSTAYTVLKTSYEKRTAEALESGHVRVIIARKPAIL